MNGNNWLWFALFAFLVFCILSMLFMRRRKGRQHDAVNEGAGNSDK